MSMHRHSTEAGLGAESRSNGAFRRVALSGLPPIRISSSLQLGQASARTAAASSHDTLQSLLSGRPDVGHSAGLEGGPWAGRFVRIDRFTVAITASTSGAAAGPTPMCVFNDGLPDLRSGIEKRPHRVPRRSAPQARGGGGCELPGFYRLSSNRSLAFAEPESVRVLAPRLPDPDVLAPEPLHPRRPHRVHRSSKRSRAARFCPGSLPAIRELEDGGASDASSPLALLGHG